MPTGRHTHGVLTDPKLLALGKDCDVEARSVHCSDCRQLDYLPVACVAVCGKHFCQDCAAQHYRTCAHYLSARDDAVRLKNRLAPHCPSCRATLSTPKVRFNATDAEWAAAVEHRVHHHVESGCQQFVYLPSSSNPKNPTSSRNGLHSGSGSSTSKVPARLKAPRCKAKGCKTRLGLGAVKVTCSDCCHTFCLRHRFAEKHACKGSHAAAAAAVEGTVAAGAAAAASAGTQALAAVATSSRKGGGSRPPQSCATEAARLQETPWALAAEERRRHRSANIKA